MGYFVVDKPDKSDDLVVLEALDAPRELAALGDLIVLIVLVVLRDLVVLDCLGLTVGYVGFWREMNYSRAASSLRAA